MVSNDTTGGEPKTVKRPRHKKPKEELTQFERRSLALTPEQWASLERLAEVLEVYSRAGPRFGKPSWRTMIAKVADDAPNIIKQTIDEREWAEISRRLKADPMPEDTSPDAPVKYRPGQPWEEITKEIKERALAWLNRPRDLSDMIKKEDDLPGV